MIGIIYGIGALVTLLSITIASYYRPELWKVTDGEEQLQPGIMLFTTLLVAALWLIMVPAIILYDVFARVEKINRD